MWTNHSNQPIPDRGWSLTFSIAIAFTYLMPCVEEMPGIFAMYGAKKSAALMIYTVCSVPVSTQKSQNYAASQFLSFSTRLHRIFPCASLDTLNTCYIYSYSYRAWSPLSIYVLHDVKIFQWEHLISIQQN